MAVKIVTAVLEKNADKLFRCKVLTNLQLNKEKLNREKYYVML